MSQLFRQILLHSDIVEVHPLRRVVAPSIRGRDPIFYPSPEVMDGTTFKAHRILPLLNRLLKWWEGVQVYKKPDIAFYLEGGVILIESKSVPVAKLHWESSDADVRLVFAAAGVPFESKQFIAAFIHQVLSSAFQRVDMGVEWAETFEGKA